jgi:hypothetical protein
MIFSEGPSAWLSLHALTVQAEILWELAGSDVASAATSILAYAPPSKYPADAESLASTPTRARRYQRSNHSETCEAIRVAND